MRHRIILLVIVISEAVIIAMLCFFLGRLLYDRFFPTPTIIQLDRESILSTPIQTLKYYYKKRQAGSFDHPETTINSIGSNERFEYTLEKPESTFRIIALGDSNTYGLGVATKDNWTELLEAELTASNSLCNGISFEVINLGVPGYDIEYAATRFAQDGKPYDPDMILWLLNLGDFYTRRELELEKMEQLTIADGDRERHLSTIVNELMEEYPAEKTAEYQAQIVRDVADNLDGKVGIFTINGNHKKIMGFFKANQNIVDLASIPLTEAEQLSETDSHPNEIGHKHISNELIKRIKEQGLIPCN